MSFLAPVFLLGGLAVTLPVLFHLIRRTPRGQQVFSSLMFLSPSPPRITRRSRIEHWLLLVLRALAVVLLALAFARPFMRASASLLLDRGSGRYVAILVDTSASMRRENLWQQALRRIDAVLRGLGPQDRVALYQFDSDASLVVDFPELSRDSSAHQALIRRSLQDLAPTWNATRLDRALTLAAEALAAKKREHGEDTATQIVLVSDLQQGAELAGLQGYEWPREVSVKLESVQPRAKGNATVRWLRHAAESDVRARVTSSADTSVEEFQVGWSDQSGRMLASQTVYVPAGQTRVVKLSERPPAADRLRLTGDDHPFDNEFFASPDMQRELRVLYLGSASADDPRESRYFLERVWSETPRRKVSIEDFPAGDQPLVILPAKRPDLIVAEKWGDAQQLVLKSFLESGGYVLFVVPDDSAAPRLAKLLSGLTFQPRPEQSRADSRPEAATRFSLLSDIDFTHPIFAAFADPRFGDFTKVRFWRHVRVQLEEMASATVLAKFDDGSPAFWEQPVGEGHAVVLASSWRPEDSQLALSSKFVPLLSSILNLASGMERDESVGLVIGDPLPVQAAEGGTSITLPSGGTISLDAQTTQSATANEPGIYGFQNAAGVRLVAVNLASSESDVAPLDPIRFEQLGVRMGEFLSREDLAERERQMRDLELESRQKLWQWLIVAALVVLGIETAVAGWTARKQQREMEPAASV